MASGLALEVHQPALADVLGISGPVVELASGACDTPSSVLLTMPAKSE